MIISEEEYQDCCDESAGYCPDCDAMTRDCDTEPDAENYPCPVCRGRRAMGAEQALLCGYLEIE